MREIEQEVMRELGALRAKFLARLPVSLEKTTAYWHGAFDAGRKEDLMLFMSEIHSLAGTAGIFGLTEMSRTASSVEATLLQASGRRLTDAEMSDITSALDLLQSMCADLLAAPAAGAASRSKLAG